MEEFVEIPAWPKTKDKTMRMKKITIGIRPSNKMFRITSLGGSLIDNILSLRGEKLIHDSYFTEVFRSPEQGSISLKGESGVNALRIDAENVIFTKDCYESEKALNVKSVLDEFRVLWKAVNAIVTIKNIRRIGIVAEHRRKTRKDHASKLLLQNYTSLECNNHPSKLLLKYEDRRLTKEGMIPDVKKSDFINVIKEYYDSEMDATHPESDNINANLDVQQYYSPLFNGQVGDELTKLYKVFNEEWKKLGDELKTKGFVE